MDTVFKIIKDDEAIYYGANHFGYQDKTLKGAYLLLKKLFKKPLSVEEKTFLDENLFIFNGENEQDIEVFIDLNKKEIYIDGLDINKEYLGILKLDENYHKLSLTDFFNFYDLYKEKNN